MTFNSYTIQDPVSKTKDTQPSDHSFYFNICHVISGILRCTYSWDVRLFVPTTYVLPSVPFEGPPSVETSVLTTHTFWARPDRPSSPSIPPLSLPLSQLSGPFVVYVYGLILSTEGKSLINPYSHSPVPSLVHYTYFIRLQSRTSQNELSVVPYWSLNTNSF